MEGNWVKHCQYKGPDIWKYEVRETLYYPAIAILKRHERIIAKIWGPLQLSDAEILDLVIKEYQPTDELHLYRIAGVR
jgi:hypothetical protein